MLPGHATSQQRQAAQGPADEVEQRVGGRRHHPGRARVAEPPLDRRAPCGTPRRRRPSWPGRSTRRRSSAAALTSSTRSWASARPCSSAASVSSRRARVRSVSICMLAKLGARPELLGQRLVEVLAAGCAAGARRSRRQPASHQPDAHRGVAAPGTHGSTAARAMSRPRRPSPSIAPCRHPHALRGHRAESLPRRPSPSNVPADATARRCRPGPATASSARRPPAAGSTRRSCRPRRPRSPSSCARRAGRSPPSAVAVLTGAQNWLRDPASENASVDR